MNVDSLNELKKPVKAPKSLRVLINAAATAAWYDLTDDNLKKKVVERLQDVCHKWCHSEGVRFITSFDDDLFMVGDTRGFGRCSIYIIFEVQSHESAVSMVDDFRQGDPTLHTYFSLTATLGRAFWPIEAAV